MFCPYDGTTMEKISSVLGIYRCGKCRRIIQNKPSPSYVLRNWKYEEEIDLGKSVLNMGVQTVHCHKKNLYINLSRPGYLYKQIDKDTFANLLPLDQRHHRIFDFAILPDGTLVFCSLSDFRLYKLRHNNLDYVAQLKAADSIHCSIVDLEEDFILFIASCSSSLIEIIEYNPKGKDIFSLRLEPHPNLHNISAFCLGDLDKDYFLYHILDSGSNFLFRFDSYGNLLDAIDFFSVFHCQPVSMAKLPDQSYLAVACKDPNCIVFVHGIEPQELLRIELGPIEPSGVAFSGANDLFLGEKRSPKIHRFSTKPAVSANIKQARPYFKHK